MRLAVIIALLIIIAAPAALGATSPPLQLVRGDGGEPPTIEVLSSDANGLTLEFSLPSLSVDEVTAAGQTYQVVGIPGGGSTGAVGSPEVPIFVRLVSIPARAGVQMNATIVEEEELSGYRLNPVQPDQGQGFAFDAAAYARDDFGDLGPTAAGGPAILRDLRVVPLSFQPVRYNPARGVMKVARRIRVQVTFGGENHENMLLSASRSIPSSFDAIYRKLVVNYNGPADGEPIAPGTWVVICANDTGVTSRLQPLLDWRHRKGYPVRLATTAETGTTKEAIKAWLQNAYDTWPVKPEYVAIAGDADGNYSIPTWFENLSGYNGCGDHPYTQLAGGDVLADVNLGRISFSTYAELETIVAKIVGYESNPYTTGDPSWFTRACLVGDPSSSGISVVQLQQWAKIRLQQIKYTQVDTVFSGDFLSQMMTDLNRGDTIFSYRGWVGMSGLDNSHVYQLTNGWKLPFCVTITCGTGTFAGGTSITEAFIRAGSATAPKGGIGAIGTATLGTHTRYNNCIHYGVLYGLLYEGLYTMGADLTRGKLEMYLNYGQTDPNHVLIWSYWNNLMGDPAAECWTTYPDPMTVTAPSNIPIGTNSVTVAAVDNLGHPIEGAQVCLWKGTESYTVAYTGADGTVEVPVKAVTAGNMLLTVTKHEHAPYLATIPVAASPLFVAYQSSSIDDDNNGQSHGNGNGVVNPGEAIELGVTLKNFGILTATGVTATLTSADPYVQVLGNSQSFGDIPPGGSAASAGPYLFSVDFGCPDARSVRFGLDVQSDTSVWHSLIDVPVVSAHLVAVGTTIYGAGGSFDPGQTVQMSVKLDNFGGAAASGVTGVLVPLTRFAWAPQPTGSWPDIPTSGMAENVQNPFTISSAPNTPRGFLATFRLVTSFSGGARDTTVVGVNVGHRTSTDPVGPDLRGYWAYDNTDTGYPDAPVYNWIELDPSYGGNGTILPLNDHGQYQDCSCWVTLPFNFTYYGTNYLKATICSNGWIAMGDTYLTEYRNWTIPGAGGPQAMIAPFWDDLAETNGKVLDKYDATNHIFIVEWSHATNDPGSQQTFELILYDPIYYPSATGDGTIVFQYNTVNNNDGSDNYATVGIENIDHTDGVLYTFANLYPDGAAHLAAGRAIRFVGNGLAPAGAPTGPAVRPIFALSQNTPNPWQSATAIRFSIAQAGAARLFVYDVQGRTIRKLVQGPCPAGAQTVVWDGRDDRGADVSPGIYFYRLDADARTSVRKLIRLK